ncbi:glycoside hydrolase family 3 C-terminal domain-containing protein [Solwaraspora sp. WMMD406]|uniref:glycoside hydrolase family 3 protein n=1 Tax=Solwaraspora sp. WMMD406 TaxID=3016095 RepID=UPI002416FE90|nr:glycoside hydrolase family 3 protein [Solwaraspora sp. WMMD406]MDG4765443.1 glycoside hydrolase family 3 C-terminal domain-containing protein [Solwaraspora sp. WMMD406]
MSDSTFRDPEQPLTARVTDLLSRLTRAEKIALLHQHQPAVRRLGLPAFRTGTEALHGVAWLGPATVFPQAIGLASSWNPRLLSAVGEAVGTEARAFHHKDPGTAGLNVWAPVVNPLRDPRWGRNEEGYAEDPWLTGELATAYAGGLRGDHPTYLRTAPTLKHFLGYNNETDRDTTSSNLPPRVLHEYELPAFRAPIAAGAAVAVMASYNLVNGRPAHLSPLIDDELRRWTDQDVLVVGDAGAATNIAGSQAYLPDHVTGYAAALRAGIDSFTENDADPAPTIARITEALDRGLLDEADVDQAVRHILAIRIRLGDLDPADRNPYAAIDTDVINCPAHQRLARAAARASIVLLRNAPVGPQEPPLLPLDSGRIRRIAVIGPLADTVLTDWYSGTLPYAVTARDGLAARFDTATVTPHEGVDRIALRVGTGTAYLRASGDPDGGPLTASAPEAVPESWFDLFSWGDGVIALRSVANGRHLAAADDGVLRNDRTGPGGWVVNETFRLVRRADGRLALHHLARDRFVIVDPDGVLRADATSVDTATAFTVELVADGARDAAALARDADVAVVVLGNHPMVCGRETEDRTDLALPAGQESLLRAVHAANPRTVLVLASSYPYAVEWADQHVPAILWSAHGGQEYGAALAEVLCGDADPAGRLTQTWYRRTADLPDLLDYDIIASDATYLYFRGDPLYPFGHGLSYTTFDYRDLRLSAATTDADGLVEVSVTVRNTGTRAGTEVVQLYTRQRHSRVKQPLRQLRGFHRIELGPGAQEPVRFRLAAADLASWDVTRGRPVVESARHTVAIGRSCTDLVATTTLTVRGERVGPRDPLAGPLWAADNDDYAGIEPTDDVDGTARDTDADTDGVTGSAVGAAEAGGWIAFAGVDFGSGPTAVTARVAQRRADCGPDGSTLTLRLDDPLVGPVAGTLPVPVTGGRHEWATVRGELHGVSGVRDLYLLFGAAGATVSYLNFADATDGGPAGDKDGGA